MNDETDDIKEPELFINGKKIKFHYNRKERLNLIHNKKEPNNFLSPKNRFLHIQILSLIFILFIVFIILKFVDNAKSTELNGFKIYLSKKQIKNSPNIDFKFRIQNNNNNENIIEENNRKFIFKVYNESEQLLFNKDIVIQKKYFAPNESFEELIIFEKPNKNKYKAYLYLNKDNNENELLLSLDFTIN